MSPWVLVFVGGGAGAVLRLGVARWAGSPGGTLLVNLIGSMALAALLHPRVGAPEPWRLALGTGLLGGFTTYSTFNVEVLTLLQQGRADRAAALATGTIMGCLAAGAAGWWLAERLAPA